MLVWLVASAVAGAPTTTETTDLPVPGTDDEVPEAIFFGERETGFPAAVGLGAFNFTACTGSMITPRIVLSAAHCGADLPLELVVDLGHAFFGDDAMAPEQTIGFTDVFLHPDYVPLGPATFGQPQQLPEYDVALLVLAEDAPVEPVWIRTEPLDEVAVGSVVTSVGWGITENTELVAGEKFSADLVVDRLDDFFVLSDSSTNDNGANICSGDSGGPQYHELEDGTLEQWAVHSWGDQNCLQTSGSTRTDIVADWILEHVEIVHGTRDLCAVNARYDDGVCDAACDEPDPDCAPAAPADEGEAAGGCSTTPAAPAGLLGLLALLVARRGLR